MIGERITGSKIGDVHSDKGSIGSFHVAYGRFFKQFLSVIFGSQLINIFNPVISSLPSLVGQFHMDLYRCGPIDIHFQPLWKFQQ